MKFVVVLVVAGCGVLALARPVPPLDVDFLGGWELEISVQSTNSSTTRPFAEDCREFCSHTYPQHTYPEPENFKACATGCRAAQLDAFIAWPMKAAQGKCDDACKEMYPVDDQRFACTAGCKTPTIDSTFPNRSHLYGEGNLTSEIDLLLPPLEDNSFSYFLDSFFLPQSPVVFEDLAEHAQNMEMLVVPYLRSDVTVLTNDGVYTYREYSFDNGGAMLVYNIRSPSAHPVYEDSWVESYQRRRSGCVWLLHRAVLNRLLMVLTGGLVIAAMATCFLSSCGTEIGKKGPPKITSIKTSPPLSTKKAPYDLGSQFIIPEKIHVGSYGQVNHKITML